LDFEELVRGTPALDPTEPFLLRLLVLWLLTLLVFGVQVLLEKQRKAREEEATESHAREEHLHTTGRLAAQVAHQLKNPLAIINNAAFTLQRAVASGAPPRPEQVQIIRDEVDRADRIITELMDYTQLEAGRVEKLDFIAELEGAVAQVFPSGASFEVKIAVDCARGLPPLLMQRRHLKEILVNVLLNAREAIHGRGQVLVTAREGPDNVIEVSVQDDGPGIPPERIERIFEPYFTTKEKGTGIGLAIVKQHVEMYGGTVGAESMLGKGARFVLHLPTRSFTREHVYEQPPATPSPRR
jgi:signal transduction histidine kinase